MIRMKGDIISCKRFSGSKITKAQKESVQVNISYGEKDSVYVNISYSKKDSSAIIYRITKKISTE